MGGAGAVLIGIDRDGDAAAVASGRLKARNEELGGTVRCEVYHSNYSDIDIICKESGVYKADGILFDLGVSSHQLDEAERGFSFQKDSMLDMRMDRGDSLTAADIVNNYPEGELRGILFKYGEERWSARISKFIADRRAIKPIRTTHELVGIILAAVPQGARRDGPHPARRTFQALRIATNDELGALEGAIRSSAELLKAGGRLCVISYHSIEDRIVKNTIRDLAAGCNCPKSLPVCVCGRSPVLRQVTRKPVAAGAAELQINPRARSAKLRVSEKLD
jgi:16S rRNA (cytosine1402-N4)-methyltransferase